MMQFPEGAKMPGDTYNFGRQESGIMELTVSDIIIQQKQLSRVSRLGIAVSI